MPDTAKRYRGLEGHACPSCAEEGVWTHLQWLLDRKGNLSPIETRTDRREFHDDTDVTSNGAGDFPDAGKGQGKWIHHFTTYCHRCNKAFNKQSYTYHVFEDKELPLDYWADHEANIALMRAHGIKQERIEAHEQLLARLGIRRES